VIRRGGDTVLDLRIAFASIAGDAQEMQNELTRHAQVGGVFRPPPRLGR
jgi:hypothetical protein